MYPNKGGGGVKGLGTPVMIFKKRKIQTYKMINSHLSTKPSLQNDKLLIEIFEK